MPGRRELPAPDTAEAVEAARSALIELTPILGEYRDDVVLVGGWIPELLLPADDDRHVGSIDVDLALNHKELTEAGYQMIGEILRKHGYEQDTRQPFVFRKRVHGQIVQVDFLAGEYGGTGRGHRTQKATPSSELVDYVTYKAPLGRLAASIPGETTIIKVPQVAGLRRTGYFWTTENTGSPSPEMPRVCSRRELAAPLWFRNRQTIRRGGAWASETMRTHEEHEPIYG